MRNQYQGWTQMLTKGQTICVECQPLAMKRKLGVRCSGDGIYLKVTLFTSGKSESENFFVGNNSEFPSRSDIFSKYFSLCPPKFFLK